MRETIGLEIYTPSKKYFSGDISFLGVQSDNYRLGLTPNHSPIISSIKISELEIRMFDDEVFHYATSGGMLSLKDGKIIVIVDSIERSDEIDYQRALESKKRAEERLLNNDFIDTKRANLSYLRAVNRLDIFNRYNNN
ncbi:MAG: ATP synthase F1 subunit epsilon [Bacilli bacterium]